MNMSEKKCQVWFITGANKGLGSAIAREALDNGHKVVATARKPEGIKKVLGNSPNLMIVKLDITNNEQVQSAVDAALKQFGRIDVLMNNAGYGILGYFEELSEKLIRQHIETNVLGTMKLTRAVLPSMRKQGSGWIIITTSTSGIRAVEGNSVYSASKFALEGWTEGMSIDLKPFGIQCMILEPGAFRTDFFNEKTSLAVSDNSIEDYKPMREKLLENAHTWHQKQPGDPSKLAKALMTAINSSNPPLRLLVGKAAVEAVEKYFKDRVSEFEDWREVSTSTDFD